ncbi:Late embryogenesis abundant protein [Melia azedarach]|uniref:Late embryogenesis abundant protein n=1 Tax=Melia azedarach TaxID=155640 RepID=A0ACC1YWE3_MELAZ|nr:Late embryogenesis abundant protein [Melia azedarach]
MQAIKDKMNDMSAMRKAKADAKSEERAERDLAKARVNVAHEVRLAKEAEAEMDLHVAKATEKAEKEIAKHSPESSPAAATAATN